MTDPAALVHITPSSPSPPAPHSESQTVLAQSQERPPLHAAGRGTQYALVG